jgi:hypothetical protein
MAEDKPIPFPKRSTVATRWMKRVAVVAIVCVALMTAAVSAKAFAPDFWEKVASWTREFFRFEDMTDGTEGKEPETENNAELDSLREAIGKYTQADGLMPDWIPRGYVCTSVEAKETPKARRISAIYEKDGERLIIQIRQEFGSPPFQIEKNEDLIEIYSADGVDYYIFSNMDTIHIAWITGECECLIIGNFAIDEAKKVIDSI